MKFALLLYKITQLQAFYLAIAERCNSNAGTGHGMLPYKKSKSHDERISTTSVNSCDLERIKFRRSFSQGNIYEKTTVTNLGPITNGKSDTDTDKESKKCGRHILGDVSIIPCFKVDDASTAPSKLTTDNENSLHKAHVKSPTDSPLVSGILFYCR